MGKQKQAKAARQVAREELNKMQTEQGMPSVESLLTERIMASAPHRVLTWIADGITQAFSEINDGRRIREAVHLLCAREDYPTLNADMLAVLEGRPIERDAAVEEEVVDEDAEAKASAFLEAERAKLRLEVPEANQMTGEQAVELITAVANAVDESSAKA